jgi:hypothetical protein
MSTRLPLVVPGLMAADEPLLGSGLFLDSARHDRSSKIMAICQLMMALVTAQHMYKWKPAGHQPIATPPIDLLLVQVSSDS